MNIAMASKMTEIRWHGRGGQGAKTAAQLVAQVALEEGKHSQGFPEYGPERMGAPIRGFTRVSDDPIRLHCAIERPDVVVVLDDTMISLPAITEGIDDDTVFVINTTLSPGAIREKLAAVAGTIYCVDATAISIDELGRPMPNTPMVGALVRATGCISLDALKADIERRFIKKFGERVVQGNIRSIQRAYEEVVQS
jgi:pyruvate ferredoxin oxidoreductase gamma subunit